jgi:hypothetical protein
MADKKGFDFKKSFVTDRKKEVEGTWVETNIDGQTLKLLIARDGNPRYKSYLRSLLKRHERALSRNDDKALELFEQLENEVIAHTILLGWEDIYMDDEVLEYSPEVAQKLLEWPDFKKLVVDLSQDFSLFKEASDEEVLKN